MKKCILSILFLLLAATMNAQVVLDTRSVNSPPTYYGNEVKYEFKLNSIIGLSSATSYYGALMTIAPWSDNSGGVHHQIGFNGASVFYRTGLPENSSWNSWRKILIEDANGFVGIGTTDPTTTLDVYGPIKNTSNLNISADGTNGYVASRVYLNSHNNYRGAGVFSLGQTNNWFIGNPYTDHASSFIISAAPLSTGADQTAQLQYAKFYINSNGNVGIGTTTPDSKLAVNGKIHTKEVKVDLSGWSDFVFEETYKLPTLEEVEKHIKEKGHLKDIPSAKDVAKNGIYLGEMDSKLLRKIEELTLYTIQQERNIKEQTERINRLESLNKKLLDLQKRLKILEKNN